MVTPMAFADNDAEVDQVTAYAEDRFVTTWETASPGDSITIPVGGATGTYTVDWGDGTVTVQDGGGGATHVYDAPGKYIVQVSGDFTRISLGDDPRGASMLRSIDQWGSIKWTTMESAFEGATNMEYRATDAPDLSSVTDTSFMFFRASSFNGNLSNWDVSSVTDMSYMFTYASSFNGDISNWDVSSVTDMFLMLSGTAFNQDIGSWDVSSVTDMSRMFNHAPTFNQDIGSWDVSSVRDMSHMFQDAISFNGDISNWDVSAVTDMSHMFDNAASFNQDIGFWDVSSVRDVNHMFLNAVSFNQDLNDWDVSSVKDMAAMFAHATFFNGDISNWDVSSVTDMNNMFAIASFFRGDLSNWDVSAVTDMNNMFAHSAFNSDIGSWDVSAVTDMSRMFLSANAFNSDIGSWDVSAVTDMSSMFWFAASFNQDIGSWDVSAVTDMSRMFNHAASFNQDISSWDVSSVKDMSRMFDFAYSMAEQPAIASSAGVAATLPEYARYDADSIDSRVQAAVIGALTLYWAEGQAAFEMIIPEEALSTDTIYPFVLDAETLETVAHGAFPDRSGVIADSLEMVDKPIGRILDDLERDGGTWVEYMATNPANGLIQPKRTYLYLYDGYIFGSGHYLTESKVKYVVEDAVRLYESKGQDAFDIITPEETLLTSDLYPFVFNATTLKTVAHGAIPDRLGHVPYSILNTGDKSVEEIMADLERDGSTWVEYVFTNPATETKQLKRSWLYLYDGYIFNSGYYIQDSRVQSLVDEALILYRADGEGAFDTITPEVVDHLALQSSFVLDGETLEVVAHGLLPDLVGTVDPHLTAADRSLERIMEDLRSKEGVWVWHMAHNPGTQTDQLTRTYLSLYGDYIFGAGYSLPDSRIQSVVDESIYTYRNNPETGFDVMTDGALNRLGSYPLVRNATHIAAHGTLPHLVGPFPDVPGARSTANAINAAAESGGTVWQQIAFVSPYTGTDQIKRSWATLHDGYLFISNYNVPDADTQSAVDYAIFIYESNKENDAWIDIITPEEPVITDDLYPFVINATSWTRLADGVVPDRVGKAETILYTADRSVEDVLADLEANVETWVTYTFHNPSTDTEQLKRTYLKLRDGLVFGSGYYILDSQVQAVTYAKILEYGNKGRDAVLADINTIPEQPVSTYVFVVDPVTGAVQAQGADPNLLGATDWDAISSTQQVDYILSELRSGAHVWVSYQFTNPVTGEMEDKRTWLIMHDGLVFGSGYYSSS